MKRQKEAQEELKQFITDLAAAHEVTVDAATRKAEGWLREMRGVGIGLPAFSEGFRRSLSEQSGKWFSKKVE